jgi:hypothetical protein
VYHFSQRSHVESSASKRRYAHDSSAFTGSATSPAEPCTVKVASDKEYMSDFG